jgi:hypothetical protein
LLQMRKKETMTTPTTQRTVADITEEIIGIKNLPNSEWLQIPSHYMDVLRKNIIDAITTERSISDGLRKQLAEKEARLKVLEIHEFDRKEWQGVAQSNCEKLSLAIEGLEKIADSIPADDADGTPQYAKELLTKLNQTEGKEVA